MPVTYATSQAVNARFARLHAKDPKAATDWFYAYCTDVGYVQVEAIARNICWTARTRWGNMEMTINLSKPEKDPKAIELAARNEARTPSASSRPRCALCMENEGYPGRSDDDPQGPWPDRSNLRIVRTELGGESWGLQFSPYCYYREHCIAMSADHRPMHIDRKTFSNLLEFVDWLPHYFIGSNADLPIVGGSILSHDHYQAGRHVFPMMRAHCGRSFRMGGFPDVRAGIVEWPLTVLRLESRKRHALVDAACRILETWRGYEDQSVGIVARSADGAPHNTLTPIARKTTSGYVLDLALRCNVTSLEHPLGVFHPHEGLHRVKRENIGLIEVMGRAILPPRVTAEFPGIETRHSQQELVGNLFSQVLEDCGVFKWDTAGRAALGRFLERIL